MSDATQGSQGRHLPYAVIPLIAIIAAGFVLLVCFVLYKHATNPGDELRPMTEEQAIYMREVRQRNREDIEALTGYYHSQTRRQSRYSGYSGYW
jgi:hypothetical protein